MSEECPKCQKEGRLLGFLSCQKDPNSDCWIEMCCHPDCTYALPHTRSRNMKVEIDRRKK